MCASTVMLWGTNVSSVLSLLGCVIPSAVIAASIKCVGVSQWISEFRIAINISLGVERDFKCEVYFFI